MSKIKNLIVELSKLTVLEAAELAKVLEDRGLTGTAQPRQEAESDSATTQSGNESATSNIGKLADELSTLTVLEAAELSKSLEDHWGVTAAVPIAVAAAGASPAEAAEEKTEFDVVLTSDGGNKVAALKAVRAVSPQLTLTQAKTLVESLPQVVKAGASKEEAEKIKNTLEEAGAKVELK